MDKVEIEKELIRLALAEDIGAGDITTAALKLDGRRGKAVVVAKAGGVISGTAQFAEVFQQLSRSVKVKRFIRDGSAVASGDKVLGLSGSLNAILTGERTAMNILCHLSGIATMTAAMVAEIRDLPVKILDTRKTMPGMRRWEKLAVSHGGACNHRLGLFDMYLIKENHIAATGGFREALEKVESHRRKTRAKIEIEVRNLDELGIALSYRVDYILLDNFSFAALKKAVSIARGHKVILEASGNVNKANVRKTALTGVDRISIGRITHSAPALDLSMKVVERN
ncbi:MAG: nicotinate-nucleotide diphosphorylase (carboxylating) [candidate division Zixibacteria bacterium RBG_16_53_22]|nr:MAG: nicotinate-nucleotide diphosphorylase (carboxylating) [candidate division Zixibacteria bacterium RBG_16_53_22]